MQPEKSKSIICWVLVAVCMGVIFYFSSQTAAESSNQSDAMLNWLMKIFGDNIFTDFIIRKSAHCLEFTGLAWLMNLAFYETFRKRKPFFSVLCTVCYAVTDEFHQFFIENRSCELRDVAIDAFGAVLGTAMFLLLFFLTAKLSQAFAERKRFDNKNK